MINKFDAVVTWCCFMTLFGVNILRSFNKDLIPDPNSGLFVSWWLYIAMKTMYYTLFPFFNDWQEKRKNDEHFT